MKTIILFGSTGMLGNYFMRIYQDKYNIIAITRKDYDIIENNYKKLHNIISYYTNPIVINCAGVIPQRNIEKNNPYLIINSLFPKMLEKICLNLKLKFIHISTNCVFNYSDGNSNELIMPNEDNIYGLSKILGEPSNAMVIRTSIIGEEVINKKSFMEWVLSNKNGKINGYTNYYWNGCTCLTLVNYVENIIKNKLYRVGIKHIYSSETVSKYELASIINDVYNLNIEITPVELETPVNKTLSSIYTNTKINESLKEQIITQKNIDLKEGTYDLLESCRCCSNPNLKNIWSLQKVPLAGAFLKKINDCIFEKYYPLTLLYCEKCYCAFVKEIIQENKLFKNINNNNYFYYSSQIESLVNHFKELYNYVTERYQLQDKNLLEIGCNDGVFLNNFNTNDKLYNIIGIDPSETINSITNPLVIKINDFFNDKTTNYIVNNYGKMDFIVACNCLAHINDIDNIFKNLKLCLTEKGIIIMEVHYIKHICKSMNFDFIYHEHMSYYSINGIYNICKKHNLILDNVQHIDNHGGSLRVIIKNKTNNNDIYINEKISHMVTDENITSYMNTFSYRNNIWKEKIIKIISNVKEKDKFLTGYGAGGRTNIILSFLQTKFDFILDDSKSKINTFLPLFHTQIINSNEIYKRDIKTIFILAWPYSKHIIQKHKKFIENGGKFIIILPEIIEITSSNYDDFINIL